jgi:hypothetical protein
MSKALLDAWDYLRDALTPDEIEKLLNGDTAILDRALLQARQQLQATVAKGFAHTVKDLPKAGKVDGQVAVAFDTLNPKIVDAVRTLDSRVVNGWKDDIRDLVRAHVENGLRDGKSPRTVAKDLRSIIGLSPTQAENAQKYGEKLAAKGKTPEQVEKAVAAYQRKAIAQNANTNAATATRDSLKLGQHLTWKDAADKGLVDLALMDKTWITVGDDRVRDEHRAMAGETVPFDNTFSNGEVIPGESAYNCRCVLRYRQRRAA